MAYNFATEAMAEASFAGVVFRVRNESITRQGRRVVPHEYLGTDRIFAEDLGEIPPFFTIDAFIHSDRNVGATVFAQPNFIQKAEQFRNKLRERRTRPAKLTLPTIGTVNVIVLSFTEDRSQQSVGEVKFTINFVQGAGSIVSNEAPKQSFDVYVATAAARTLIEEISTEKWEEFVLPPELPSLDIDSYLTMLNDLNSLATDISNRTRNLFNAGIFGRIKNTLRNFATAIPNLLAIPSNLFKSIITQFEEVIGIFSDISDALGSIFIQRRRGRGRPIL